MVTGQNILWNMLSFINYNKQELEVYVTCGDCIGKEIRHALSRQNHKQGYSSIRN
jgi:hypothetical protein